MRPCKFAAHLLGGQSFSPPRAEPRALDVILSGVRRFFSSYSSRFLRRIAGARSRRTSLRRTRERKPGGAILCSLERS